MNPHHAWLGIFAIWAFFLTGAFANVLGSPGVLQAIRLQNLLHSKTLQMESIQSQVNELQSDAESLEKSSAVQQREIRRVLGYAAPDELIFDFSTGSSL